MQSLGEQDVHGCVDNSCTCHMKGAQNHEDSKGYKTYELTKEHGRYLLKHESPK
jgi:hypothetical protein